jgi:MoxR-like ATPase
VRRVLGHGRNEAGHLVGHYAPSTEAGQGPFAFRLGMLPTAMLDGTSFLADEVNLAATEHAERMNSVLDRRELTLYEHDNRRIVADSGFRMFATMNPAEYAGRQRMSPAAQARWDALYLEAPGPRFFETLAHLWVRGGYREPVLTIGGEPFALPRGLAPVFPTLARLEPSERVVQAVARVHGAIARAGEHRDLGRGRREPYVFTVRQFQHLMRRLDADLGELEASDRASTDAIAQAISAAAFDSYTQSLDPGPDRERRPRSSTPTISSPSRRCARSASRRS